MESANYATYDCWHQEEFCLVLTGLGCIPIVSLRP